MSNTATTPLAPPPESAWTRFWFASMPLTRLGAFRILMCGLAFYDVVIYSNLVLPDAALVSAGGAPRPWNPIYLFDLLGLQPISLGTAQTVYAGTLIALGLATFGVAARWTCLLGAVMFVYWTGLAYSFGKPHHDKIALTFALCALPLAPVGARLSIDSLLRRWRVGRRPNGSATQVPTHSTWAAVPLRLAQLTVALGYFLAGASKLWKGGLDWFNGYSLQGIMMGHDARWSAFFAQHVGLCQVFSIGLVAVQTLFPLVLIWPRLLWFFIPLATSFHLMTWQTMDTGPYMRLWLVMAAFLPLERVPDRVRTWLRAGGLKSVGTIMLVVTTLALILGVILVQTHLPVWILAIAIAPLAWSVVLYLRPSARFDLLFDGNCRLCRGAVGVLQGLDWAKRIRPIDGNDRPLLVREFPEVDPDALVDDIHGVDTSRRVSRGFDTYRTLSWRLPALAPFWPLLFLPPVAWLGRRIYRHVANVRKRDGCGDDFCPIP